MKLSEEQFKELKEELLKGFMDEIRNEAFREFVDDMTFLHGDEFFPDFGSSVHGDGCFESDKFEYHIHIHQDGLKDNFSIEENKEG